MTAERPNEAAASNSFEFDALREAVRYRTALVKEFTPFLSGRVIEIGAGIGQITEHLMQLPAIQTLVSIEPDSAFCQAFRSTYPRQTLFEGTIDRLPSGSDAQAILSINVLEHIRDDAQEIISYQKLLRQERGHLCLFVPARPEIYAPIDKDFGHHRRYTLPELSGKLQRAGFEIIRLHYFNCVGYLAWWFNFCILKKRSFDASSVRLFDRIIFPVVHALESSICHPPVGQSLLAVARAKP